jgi:hypothetical protein
LAAPLINLVKTTLLGLKPDIDKNTICAFNALKKAFIEALVLAYFNLTLETVVKTDVSN